MVWLVSPAWEAVKLTLGGCLHLPVRGPRPGESTLPIWERQSWLLQDKCLAIFYLPPTQIDCLFKQSKYACPFVVLNPTDLGATIVVAPEQMPGNFLSSLDADCLPF